MFRQICWYMFVIVFAGLVETHASSIVAFAGHNVNFTCSDPNNQTRNWDFLKFSGTSSVNLVNESQVNRAFAASRIFIRHSVSEKCHTLILKSVTQSDAGKYFCKYGNKKLSETHLTVIDAEPVCDVTFDEAYYIALVQCNVSYSGLLNPSMNCEITDKNNVTNRVEFNRTQGHYWKSYDNGSDTLRALEFKCNVTFSYGQVVLYNFVWSWKQSPSTTVHATSNNHGGGLIGAIIGSVVIVVALAAAIAMKARNSRRRRFKTEQNNSCHETVCEASHYSIIAMAEYVQEALPNMIADPVYAELAVGERNKAIAARPAAAQRRPEEENALAVYAGIDHNIRPTRN